MPSGSTARTCMAGIPTNGISTRTTTTSGSTRPDRVEVHTGYRIGGFLPGAPDRLHGADPGDLVGRDLLRAAVGPGRTQRRWRAQPTLVAGDPAGLRKTVGPGPTHLHAVLHLPRPHRDRGPGHLSRERHAHHGAP